VITVYAQNLEDVYLWRALGHIEHGRYVDVGAHDPDDDSVTRLFYEHGWRGINIEPVPTMVERLVARRPEDIVVCAACGEHEGEMTLYEVVGTGLSTLDADHAEEIRKLGRTVIAHQTPLVTLNRLFEEHGGDPVHFLKIDVEGAERSVLAGCDFSRWRPWVLVIEATIPMSQEVNDQTWEPLVTGARYEKVLFDGLNNYYVAEEHPELKAAFALPPNFFDDFMLPSSHGRVDQSEIEGLRRDAAALSHELESARASASHELESARASASHELESARASASHELESARASARNFEELARSTEQWAKSTEAQLKLSEKQATAAQAKAAQAMEAVKMMRHSISWTITAPLRVVPSAMRASRRIAVPNVKDVARPVLTAGLRVVRSNSTLRRVVKKVVSKVPSAEVRLRAFASARPADKETR
jgi:FkbM family methyltransferase